MDVVRVEGRRDLVEVTVDETLGPCHDGLGLGALLWSGGHCFNVWRGGRRLKGETFWASSSMSSAFPDILGGVRGGLREDSEDGKLSTVGICWRQWMASTAADDRNY